MERFLGVITCTACANTDLFVNMGGEETQRMEFCFRVNKSCAFHVTISWREQRSPLIQWKLTVYNCRVAANTIQETRTVRYSLFTIFYNAQDKLTTYTARNMQLLQGFLLAVIKTISGYVRITCSGLMITSLLQVVNRLDASCLQYLLSTS